MSGLFEWCGFKCFPRVRGLTGKTFSSNNVPLVLSTVTWVGGVHPLFLWMLRDFSCGFMGYRGEVGVKFHRCTTLVSHDYMSFRQEGTPL